MVEFFFECVPHGLKGCRWVPQSWWRPRWRCSCRLTRPKHWKTPQMCIHVNRTTSTNKRLTKKEHFLPAAPQISSYSNRQHFRVVDRTPWQVWKGFLHHYLQMSLTATPTSDHLWMNDKPGESLLCLCVGFVLLCLGSIHHHTDDPFTMRFTSPVRPAGPNCKINVWNHQTLNYQNRMATF